MLVPTSSVFVRAACKRLSDHEVDPKRSNGHEFQGVKQFRAIFGPDDRKVACRFVRLEDGAEPLWDDASLKWYDARRASIGRAAEFRLYFSTPLVWDLARPDDHLYLVELKGDRFLALIVERGSDFEVKIQSLLEVHPDDVLFREFDGDSGNLDADFLEEFFTTIGIGAWRESPQPILEEALSESLSSMGHSLDELLNQPTIMVSKVARDVAERLHGEVRDPDELIVQWSATELSIFRFLESRRLRPVIDAGFSSVDEFIGAAMTALQSRKARAGHSLQNHFAALLEAEHLSFSSQCTTEGKRRPDFIFPGRDEYHDLAFPAELLTMVAVKRTCKDRWRQVISEAARIPEKHLLTLEHPISPAQTTEMVESKITLVVPKSYLAAFQPQQAEKILTITELLALIRERQEER